MSLLSTNELIDLVEAGVIRGVSGDAINAASIDLHLGDDFLAESPQSSWGETVLDLSKRDQPNMIKHKKVIVLAPGDFCLASTRETFYLPDYISGMFILKSSMARAGLEHSQAGWCDAGWHGSALTLELSNLLSYHSLKLTAGMSIGQIVLFRHTPVPASHSYASKGRYNGDKTVSGIKP
jgi:dCTP deaminase